MANGHRKILITALVVPLAAAIPAISHAGGQTDDAQYAIVEGTVINAQNSRTIPRASVMLLGMHGAGSKSVRADGNGHFSFQHVDPGQYRLTAERQGFYSDQSKREYQPMIEVAAGQYLKNVAVRLMPTAAVSGEIVDEYNDDVKNVEVTLLASATRLGQMFLRPVAKTVTDDRGQYRIAGLRPGKYYLVAEYPLKAEPLPEDLVTITVAGSGPRRNGEPQQIELQPIGPYPPFTYAPLFYPATGDFKQAQTLRLNPGDEISANFIFISAPVVSISGRVVNGMTGAPAETASVAAFWSEYMQGEGIPARTSHENGTFEIRGLAPGSYTVRANFTEDKQAYAGEQAVEVGPRGAQNVEIAALPDFVAAGHVSLAGNVPNSLRHTLVEFVGAGLLPSVRASANFPEFKFEAQLRPEKRYYVNVRNLPDEYYLKSVAISGHQLPPGNVVVSGIHGDLELVLSPAGGHIEGLLFNSKDQATRGSILLASDLPDPGPPETFRRTRADSTGKFILRGVAPGSYRILALESANLDDEINTAEFLRSLGNKGQHLLVEESGKYSVVLKLEAEDH